VLVRNGPSSRSLEDVEDYKTIIVGTDPTLVDSYACELVNKDPLSISYIREAKANNFGNFDTTKADIFKLEL
jgi:hypothetical protein